MSENNELVETGKWITRRDAADSAGCSIDTIRRAEKRHACTERYDATTNEKLLAVEELVCYSVVDACQATVPESTMTRSRVERDNRDLASVPVSQDSTKRLEVSFPNKDRPAAEASSSLESRWARTLSNPPPHASEESPARRPGSRRWCWSARSSRLRR